jgi:DNA-binding SARP family transcriptional activator/Flp pilus assembly protein TadD
LIRLRTLGTLDLRSSDGAELRAVLAQPRRVALLAYLALARPRGSHQRDTLLALFWPERSEESARNALNQAVHFLRRYLGADTLVARSGGEIGLAREHLWCDVTAFDDALDAGRPSEALEPYQGELLEGFHIGDAPEFQRWLESERARVASRYMHAIEVVAEQRETAGDFGAAVTQWRRLAARDPLSSRMALRLMRGLAAAGDPAAAVQHARVHETLLREELHVALAPEVAALVRQLQSIRASGPAPATGERTPPLRTPAYDDIAKPAPIATGSRGYGERSRWRSRATPVIAALISLLVFRHSAESRESDEAYLRALYLRGQQAEVSRSLAGLQTARAAYELALDRDSTFALAYAGLSAVYYLMADYNYAPVSPALDSARQMALRAVALDSALPETRTARAVTLGNAREFDAAEREFVRAIELDPDNARAHYWYSVLLVALGRGEEARREVTRAQQLDPLPPRGLTAMQRYAEWLTTGKRPYLDSAVTARRPILKFEPWEPWARSREATELAQVGRCSEARGEIQRAQRFVPGNNFRMLPPVAEVHWWCGDQQRARQILAEMKQLPGVEDHGYRVALVHTLFGEPDSAFAWIGRQRWTLGELTALSADQTLDPLRSDSRFTTLLRKIGIR